MLYVQVFRKDNNQAMVISSDVVDASVIFKSSRVQAGSILEHQLEAAATFHIAPKDKAVEFDLKFCNHDSEEVSLRAQKAACCKLIEPVRIASKIRVVKVSLPRFQCHLWILNVFVKTVTGSKPFSAWYARIHHLFPLRCRHGLKVRCSISGGVPTQLCVRIEITHYSRRSVWLMAMRRIAIVHVVKDKSKASLSPLPTQDPAVNHPAPPPPTNVATGYDPTLDEPRPSDIQTYLKRIDTILLVDDSGSMQGGKWADLTAALYSIAGKAIDNNAGGITICYLNAEGKIKVEGMRKEVVRQTLKGIKPSGGTPTGEKMHSLLFERIEQLDKTKGTIEYSQIKPLDLIVLTDGAANEHPPEYKVEKVLQKAASCMRERRHHPNLINVRFVQIGTDPGMREALERLARLDVSRHSAELTSASRHHIQNMVDTIPYEGSGCLTPEMLDRILVGSEHPNVRGMGV
ncbi:hypothetical protein AcW1_003854 [Taiwanofungus camphoratus]|nr:hypothetical protein AcW1_003854 [Antrodia cinnamomea]